MDLCRRLSENVGAMSAEIFYTRFNMTGDDQFYAEFTFEEMKQIHRLQGMDQWPLMLRVDCASPIRFCMVCLKPLPSSDSLGKNRARVVAATSEVRKMLHSSFPSKEDRASIDVAMSVFPTIAIFMYRLPPSTAISVINDGHNRNKKRKSSFKSIFDVRGRSLPECVAAINYFREDTHTQVVWLSTTPKAPPQESSHVIWRKMGLSTFLLCMLIKQHTGIGDGAMDHSCLSLQASTEKQEEAMNFYLKLGFVRVDDSDNGITNTSTGFQEAVKTSPEVWVTAETQLMTLLQLYKGRLFFPDQTIDLSESLSPSPLGTDWRSYHYAEFPWKFESLRKIEACLIARPILKSLSLESLPDVDRPLLPLKTVSQMSGTILGQRRVSFDSTEWLSTQDIQFLFAFLMRNPMSRSGFIHVLGPAITQHISLLMEKCMDGIVSGVPTPEELLCYDMNYPYIQKYLDSRLDIMQHKFLVFVFNVNENHWVSVVVVNPNLVFGRYLNNEEYVDNKKGCVGEDEISGWCVLDSLHGVCNENGLKGTLDTTLEEPYGFRLFLNMCSSILKDMKQKKGDGSTTNIAYEEPFGSYKDCDGTAQFPRFDFACSSIIKQSTTYDCGLAAVANSMAFVKQLQDVKFSPLTMKRVQSKGVSFVLKEQVFSLQPFWEQVHRDCRKTKQVTTRNSTQLLKLMRDEYVEVVDKVACQCVTDQRCYDQVLNVLSARGLKSSDDSSTSPDDRKPMAIDLTEAASMRKDSSTSPDDSKPSAIDLTESASMREAASAMTLLRESDSGRKSAVVKLDFEEGSPNSAKLEEQSDKQMSAVTGGMKRKRTIDTETVCLAGDLCRLFDVNVVCQGEQLNGSACCKCKGTFHHVCLFSFQGCMYCTNCYKTSVVSQCSAETLFEDLFVIDPSVANGVATHTIKDLINFTNRFFKESGLEMTVRQFYEWRNKCQQSARKQSLRKQKCNKAEREKRAQMMSLFNFTKQKYEKVMKLAKEEWVLCTDGVVNALRYSRTANHFVARFRYKNGGQCIEQQLSVTDDWVMDTYGKEIAKKLIDREDHDGFMTTKTQDGVLTGIPLDKRKITRVKYYPPSFFHKTSKTGCDKVTDEVCAKEMWRGMLSDGTVHNITEEAVIEQFGRRFVKECKALGNRKFVPIPVGNCKSSVIAMMPHLRCENAPPVQFQQGQSASCVVSSLASAFYHTSIPTLVRVARILQKQSSRVSGSSIGLKTAKCIVEEHVRWLQPKRIPRNFNWEKDITQYMFVVGVIKDSTGCCQHAVTIFRNWIYDSNEPFALPLSKESLDCCTWDIQDGAVDVASSFVGFCEGWIFQTMRTDMRKVLDDICAPATRKLDL
jgi:hypothetical protein